MSDASDPSKPPQVFQVEVPADVHAGTYADFVSIWHTPDCFVLDFAALKQPPMPATDETGQDITVLPTKIVARVKVPPAQVFEIMKALSSQLTAWETEQGTSSPPD